MTAPTTERRTKRRYAHELYPHPAEWETPPLSVAVPYLYARAVGYEVQGTSWHGLMDAKSFQEATDRTMLLIAARQRALMADAMLLGLTGEEAWEWADQRSNDESGEWAFERAAFYGVPAYRIKPYPCGPEPDHHDHYEAPDARGWRRVIRTEGKESECAECTEPVAQVQS